MTDPSESPTSGRGGTRWTTLGFLVLLVLLVPYFSIATIAAGRHAVSRTGGGLAGGGFMVALLGVVGLVFFFARRLRDSHVRFMLPLGAGVYLAWCLLAQPNNAEFAGDFCVYFHQARRLVESGFSAWELNLQAKSPTVLWFYALAMGIVGTNWSAIYLANAIVWTLQSLLLYKVLRAVPRTRDSAAFGAVLYCFFPSVISFTGLPTSESLFILLTLWSIYLCLSLGREECRGLALGRCVALGSIFALAFLTRFTGLLIAASLLLYLITGWRRSGVANGLAVKRLAALAGGAAVILTPLTIYNGLHGPGFRPNSYHGQRVVLVKGLVHHNEFDRDNELFRRAASQYEAVKSDILGDKGIGEAPDLAKYSAALRQTEALLVERVMQAPFRYALFALTKKVYVMWARDSAVLWRSLADSPSRAVVLSYRWLIDPVMAASYLLLLVAALFGLLVVLYRRHAVDVETRRQMIFLLLLPMLLMAGPHLIIEVKPRFHAPFIPFFVSIAAVVWVSRARVRR